MRIIANIHSYSLLNVFMFEQLTEVDQHHCHFLFCNFEWQLFKEIIFFFYYFEVDNFEGDDTQLVSHFGGFHCLR